MSSLDVFYEMLFPKAKAQDIPEPTPENVQKMEPVEITAENMDIINAPEEGKEYPIATQYRKNVNPFLNQLLTTQTDLSQRADQEQGLADKSYRNYLAQANKVMSQVPEMQPNTQYDDRISQLEKEYAEASKPTEKDQTSELIYALGPAVLGMLTGGTAGYAAAAPAQKAAYERKDMMEKRDAETKASNIAGIEKRLNLLKELKKSVSEENKTKLEMQIKRGEMELKTLKDISDVGFQRNEKIQDRAYKVQEDLNKSVLQASKEASDLAMVPELEARKDKRAEAAGVKLSGESRVKIGGITNTLDTLDQLQALYDQGEKVGYITSNTPIIGQFMSDTPVDTIIRKLSDDIGRLRSGGAINSDEERRFLNMLPRAGDTPEISRKKIIDIKNEFKTRALAMGVENPQQQFSAAPKQELTPEIEKKRALVREIMNKNKGR